ncbi:MAG TPA: hypothetical protein VM260_01625 [Pirellula sp.]|nr:hypothetical protein [Pirellula sp.]
MLADDLIEVDGSLETEGEVIASSRAGKGLIAGGFVAGADAAKVAGSSGTLIPKPGVLVEMGMDDWLKLGGNLLLSFVDNGELELAEVVLGCARGVLAALVIDAGLAVGGINRGAGCIVELDALGNEIGGTVDSGAPKLAKGELGKGEFVLDENPLAGELLNMSKPFDVFPGLLGLAELLAAIGDGPETSGMV